MTRAEIEALAPVRYHPAPDAPNGMQSGFSGAYVRYADYAALRAAAEEAARALASAHRPQCASHGKVFGAVRLCGAPCNCDIGETLASLHSAGVVPPARTAEGG